MISFIIPTLNEEKVIENTIGCLLPYKKEHEIIVSDGGSRDRTVERASVFATVVKHESPERQTISAGKNAGAAIAKGNFLVFLDADVSLHDPDVFFDKAENIFAKDSKLVAMSVSLQVLEPLQTIGDRLVFGFMNCWHAFLNNVVGTGVASGEFQMIRRDAFEKVGGFDGKLVASEDYELFHRLAKIGKTRFESTLRVYHTGRRAHVIGWPRLLFQWSSNAVAVLFWKHAVSKVWTEIR